MDANLSVITGSIIIWLAIAAMLLWGTVAGLRTVLRNNTRLPFFGMIERRGLTLRQVEEVVGMDELARAVRRCTFCAARSSCSEHPVRCPNEPLLRRAQGERATA
jgi:hypothetical protein